MMRLCDIRAVAEVTREAGVLLCVDNTFATPVNQRPHELGADIVMHSTTKYLNGHSDIIGGVLTVLDPDLAGRLRFLRKTTGAVPGPMDCWLCLRGTKTAASCACASTTPTDWRWRASCRPTPP